MHRIHRLWISRVAMAACVSLPAVTAVATKQPDGAAARSLAPGETAEVAPEERLRAIRREISRLRGEMEALEQQAQGLLGELERLAAELRLREAELSEVELRLGETERAIEQRTASLAVLEQRRQAIEDYLVFRLREVYKRGPDRRLRQLVGGDELESYWRALRYASWLSERDVRTLEAHRENSRQLQRETEGLRAVLQQLEGTRREAAEARRRLARGRERRSRLLAEIRDDQNKRQTAVAELEQASRELTGVVQGLGAESAEVMLDVHKFRGLLDWPVEAPVSAGFGRIVHPRFRTEVPHPGWDLEAPAGTEFRSAFDGLVRFASWLRGYGLTVIVDHGGGMLSIYAHASVLLVEQGETVLRNRALGRVGDTGSLKGPYLYFEIRRDGRPVDPADWLRNP